MMVIGLLTSEEEANELQFIAKICTLEDRIHNLVHIHQLKKQHKHTSPDRNA